MASPRNKARRKPTDGRLSDPAFVEAISAKVEAQAERSAEEQVTILAQQLNFARNHFFALAQRFAGNKVEQNQLSWEHGTDLINREMAQFDAALNQIGART